MQAAAIHPDHVAHAIDLPQGAAAGRRGYQDLVPHIRDCQPLAFIDQRRLVIEVPLDQTNAKALRIHRPASSFQGAWVARAQADNHCAYWERFAASVTVGLR